MQHQHKGDEVDSGDWRDSTQQHSDHKSKSRMGAEQTSY
jgi:hypothetical protein